MEMTSITVPTEEGEPAAEMVMYFTGLPPALRVRAAALIGFSARVMATTEVANAKMR